MLQFVLHIYTDHLKKKTLLQCMHNNMLETGVFSCKIKIELCLKIVSCDQGFKLFEKKYIVRD